MFSFNPLISDVKKLNDNDIDVKISELQKKYFFAAKTGNSVLCSQILSILEEFKHEQQIRMLEKTKKFIKNQNKNFDDLINVD